METTRQFNPDLGAADWSAILIDKVHRCSDCPIRQLAIKQPHSIFARIHMWHKTWWPGWRAHQARTCSFAVTAGTHA
jgi:hypothetical protein